MNEIHSVIVSKKVVKNISSGRKVFKFLKFVDEIKNISDLIKEKKSEKLKHGIFLWLTELFVRICGFFYYLLDNVVWFSNMGMIEKKIFNKLKWKRLKDVFSLIKNWTEVFKSIYIWYKTCKK